MAKKLTKAELEVLFRLEEQRERSELNTKLLVALYEESNPYPAEPACWLLRAREKMEIRQ